LSQPAAPVSKAVLDDFNAEMFSVRWFILIGLITAAIMEVLDTTIINVALPQMAGNLGATQEEIGWVATGYILSNVVVLPMTAFFAATFGRRRYLIGSIILFAVASFLCGISHSLVELVMWRVLQGVGGAALLSTAQATLKQIFPPEEQALVQALFLLGIIVAPTLGPTLGGWITDNYTWNWCFFINIPIALLSTFLVAAFLRDSPDQAPAGKIDFAGIGLLIVGLASLQYVLEEGNRYDWFSDARIQRLTALAVVCLSTMLWWELSPRNKHPVVEFRILNNRNLAASLFLFVALGFGLYGGTFIFPLFTQSILGFSPTATGLSLLPGGLATAVTAVTCGKLLSGKKPMADARVLIGIGIAIFLVAMWQLGHLSTAAGERDARFALIIRGAALGFLFAPINNVAFASLKPSEAQQASGLINLSRQLGGSFGIAVISSYLTRHIQFHRADLVRNIYASNPIFQTREHQIAAGLVSRGLSNEAAQRGALASIDHLLMRQAAMLSYNDVWLLILGFFILIAPAVLLLRKPRGPVLVADAH